MCVDIIVTLRYVACVWATFVRDGRLSSVWCSRVQRSATSGHGRNGERLRSKSTEHSSIQLLIMCEASSTNPAAPVWMCVRVCD